MKYYSISEKPDILIARCWVKQTSSKWITNTDKYTDTIKNVEQNKQLLVKLS